MKLLPLIVMTLLITTSCKEQKEEDKAPDETFRFGKEIAPERALSDSEFSLIKSTCTDLQNKRIRFSERGDREWSFIFTLLEKSCSDSNYGAPIEVSSALRVPRSGSVFFEAPRVGTFSSDILTDEHPSFEEICTSVLKDINVTNTITSGTVKYQYRFIKAQEGAILEMAKFSQNVSGRYTPNFIESYSVLSSAYAHRGGMVYERYRVTPCSNGSSQIYRQTLKK
ncbi:hypothetical protein [Halobacteriovorax sp. HLS]|uniref:hypothetical protein n=1 Tax=Halobacteriovorax sp. HLS TaxID=2234000 RepID=UPI000FD738FB|nr:hypothetical protein [Halobacteriovorax sp. HLS]